jgi:hypothetical protein
MPILIHVPKEEVFIAQEVFRSFGIRSKVKTVGAEKASVEVNILDTPTNRKKWLPKFQEANITVQV